MSDFESRLKELFARSPDAFLITREPEGKVLFANAAACRAFGYSEEEIVQFGRAELCDVTDPRFIEGTARRRREGSARSRLRMRRRDGTLFEALLTSVTFDTAAGEPRLCVFFHDLSEQIAAETALRDSEDQLRALSDASTEAILIHAGGAILFANAAAERSYRVPPGTFAGRQVVDFIAPESREHLRQRREEGDEGPYEGIALRADGTKFPAEVHARGITYRGQPYRVVSIRDVTASKKMEARLALADRMASLGTLAAGIAHEINNPLTFLMGNVDVVLAKLHRGALSEEQRVEAIAALSDARIGAERVQRIVQQMRAFSRASEETCGPVNLTEVVRYAASVANMEIRHRARLRVDLDAVPPVLGTEAQLGQVVLNLLVNAAHAIDEGNVDANEIAVVARRLGESQVALSVSDTGRGIEPDVLDRIFDPFITTKATGTGLGLSICHTIVSSFGGTIGVESEVARGSKFRVVLNVAPSVVAVKTPSPPQSTPRERPTGGARIVVVDDEPVLRQFLVRALTPDYEVVPCESASDALAMVTRGERMDVILCDLMMPQMTGMDLHAAIVERAPEIAARMLFLTGGVFTERAQRFLASGAVRYLKKPFPIDGLLAAIDEIRAATA